MASVINPAPEVKILERDSGRHTAFEAELLAFIQAINFAWEKGWHKLWIEMDSQVVVNCVQTKELTPPWGLKSEWFNCRRKL